MCRALPRIGMVGSIIVHAFRLPLRAVTTVKGGRSIMTLLTPRGQTIVANGRASTDIEAA
jgi:hypothetical protein